MTLRLFLASSALAACTATAPLAAQPLAGHYRIAEADGRAPLSVEEDAGKPRTPRFQFGARSYGGTSGCNFMGGLKVERGGRLYTYPGPQTQMACGGQLGAQEAAIDVLFRASPTIARDGEGVILRGAGHTLRLVREAQQPPVQDAPEAWQAPGLAGQRYEMHYVNGDSLNRRPAPVLAFAARAVTVTGLCPKPVSGSFVEGRSSLRIALKAPCPAARRHFAGQLSTVSGPNGELLIAGDGHWVAGDNLRRNRPK